MIIENPQMLFSTLMFCASLALTITLILDVITNVMRMSKFTLQELKDLKGNDRKVCDDYIVLAVAVFWGIFYLTTFPW